MRPMKREREREREAESNIIHKGDALRVLQTLPPGSVDAVVTDPPYCSGAATLTGKQADPGKKYQKTGTVKVYPPMLGDGKDQRSFILWATLWLSECWRVAKDGAPLLVFTDWRQLPAMTDAIQAAGWFWMGVVCWNKRSSRPSMGRFRNQCEYVLFGSKGRFQASTRDCLPGIFDYPVIQTQKVHLTSKPVALIKDLLRIAPEGGPVLDPFRGGGTTAVAALETGRKFVGIELSEAYAEISEKRVQDVLVE